MRLVLDTDVVLAGLRSTTGASRLLLLAAQAGVVRLLAGVALMVEYESVLKRPENLTAMGLEGTMVDAFLDDLAAMVDPVTPHFSHRPAVRDPADEMLVAIAANGRADAIVTFNLRDLRPADDRHGALGIMVCRPGDILRRLAWRPAAASRSVFPLR
ncbi:MAG: putative toxin-antitoxin system toxin component, PIN family [Acetobacteraceae bacterium]|nr:putative toxin-antitoxin system toxin component, PIN family [Acetobacteraceae bacterium]